MRLGQNVKEVLAFQITTICNVMAASLIYRKHFYSLRNHMRWPWQKASIECHSPRRLQANRMVSDVRSLEDCENGRTVKVGLSVKIRSRTLFLLNSRHFAVAVRLGLPT